MSSFAQVFHNNPLWLSEWAIALRDNGFVPKRVCVCDVFVHVHSPKPKSERAIDVMYSECVMCVLSMKDTHRDDPRMRMHAPLCERKTTRKAIRRRCSRRRNRRRSFRWWGDRWERACAGCIIKSQFLLRNDCLRQTHNLCITHLSHCVWCARVLLYCGVHLSSFVCKNSPALCAEHTVSTDFGWDLSMLLL